MAKRRSTLDLNSATAEDLSEIEGISSERARILVQQRDERGRFESWEDVQQVPGFGGRLLDKLKESASIGDTEEQDEEEQLASENGASSDAEEEEDLEPEIESLLALAQMDSEAAVAYETAAELIGEQRIADTLRGFAGDHRRHVDDIGELVSEHDVELTLAAPDPDTSTFAAMAAAVSPLGTTAALRAMIANEQFTNATYEAALDLVSEADAQVVLQRNFADEQRHLQWLSEELIRSREAEETGGEPAQP